MQIYEIRLSKDDGEDIPLHCRAFSVGAVLKRVQPLMATGKRFEIWRESRCLYDSRLASR